MGIRLFTHMGGSSLYNVLRENTYKHRQVI